MARMLYTLGMAALLLSAVVFLLLLSHTSWNGAHQESSAMDSAVERFRRLSPEDSDHLRSQATPLIQQAKAFALYLDPPPVASSSSGPSPAGRTATAGDEAIARKPAVNAAPASARPRFELHGISYYRGKPDRSMALLCEPGGSRRWVRQGTQVGHITIEQIRPDTILYRAAGETHEMALASVEAMARFAQTVTDRTASPRSERPRLPIRAAPPPVRGIRRMPPARAAAKLGSRLDIRLPEDDAQME